MAKPRVFISSTFYDLKQIRADLDNFILGLGYDVVRNEARWNPLWDKLQVRRLLL